MTVLKVTLFSLLLWFAALGAAEACQQYRDVVQDLKGNVIPDVTVTITLAGTGGAVTIYSDELCATTTPNPVQSDSTGTVSFYVPDGEYAVSFVKTGFIFQNIDRIAIYDPLGENIKTVAFFPTSDICATGTGAIDQIGATELTLVINKPVTCSITKTVPSTLTLRIEGGGEINVASGSTLTISGPLLSGERHIFTGTGTVNGMREVEASWFGAVGNGTTNDAAAIQAAINSIDTSGTTTNIVHLGLGVFLTDTTTLNLRTRVVVQGRGSILTRLLYNGNAEAVLSDCKSDTGFTNSTITTTSTNANVIAVYIKCLTAATISATVFLDDLALQGTGPTSGQHGIRLNGTGSTGIFYVRITDATIDDYDNPLVIGSTVENVLASNLSITTWGTATNDAAVAISSSNHKVTMQVNNGTGITDGVAFSVAGSNNILEVRGNPGSAGRYFLYTSGTSNTFLGQDNITKGNFALGITAFADLGTPANGTMTYCSNCTIANPCAGAGTGALAKRLNGVWVCN